MPSCLVHTGDESVTLSAATVKRLLERGDGDAALLYLALLRHQGTVPPRSLAGELRWDRSRIEAAEAVLRELGLVAPAETPPAPAEERPVYQRSEVAERLEESGAFQALVRAVEGKLGKKLTTADVGVLLGLTDYLGLPEDVVYLLVCHCAERVSRRFGPGRRPGMKQIEKGDTPGPGWGSTPSRRRMPISGLTPGGRGRCPSICGLCSCGTGIPRRRRRSISSPGRRWAFRRRRWPWPTTRPC